METFLNNVLKKCPIVGKWLEFRLFSSNPVSLKAVMNWKLVELHCHHFTVNQALRGHGLRVCWPRQKRIGLESKVTCMDTPNAFQKYFRLNEIDYAWRSERWGVQSCGGGSFLNRALFYHCLCWFIAQSRLKMDSFYCLQSELHQRLFIA